MSRESASSTPSARNDRIPPHSEEAEKGVLGSILLDSSKVMDLCIEQQLSPESFYVPAHRKIYDAMFEMSRLGSVIDVLTLAERMKVAGRLDEVGGPAFLDNLIDSTPTAAHAEYYIDIVRQKHLLRCVIDCSREAENDCYGAMEDADVVLSRVEQAFLDITERQHGFMAPWQSTVKDTMTHIEKILTARRGLSGISTGFDNLDRIMLGMRPSEMIVLAARPSMGKTALAMNIAENVALGRGGDGAPKPVAIFSLEMSSMSLAMRMLCAHAEVSGFKLSSGYLSQADHGKLIQAASILNNAPIFLDDTAGLDVLELRARARRLKKKHDVQVIVVDYLQLLRSKEFAMQGRQLETANISSNLKGMAKELKIPVLVLSQLSRAPEQRDKLGKPKLADLRDSGAIEQDADVVCLLRRPCKYEADEDSGDKTLAVVEIAKQRNGPTGEARLNFEDDYTKFKDRSHGVDGIEDFAGAAPGDGE